LDTILITGGAGFIGSHLTEHLLERDEDSRVTVIDDLSTGNIKNVELVRSRFGEDRVRFIHGRVGEVLGDLNGESFDVIYHLAAMVGVRLILDEPIRTIETNVLETAELLRFAQAGASRILLASSSEVYGKSSAVPFTEGQDVVYGATTCTRWSYACTKAIDEYLGLAYHLQFGLPVVVGRFFNTVGPRQIGRYGMVLPRFIKAALHQEDLEVYDDGSQIRSFCDVRDMVHALPMLLEQRECYGRVFNVGHDERISIQQLAELVISTLGSRSRIHHVSYEDAYRAGFEDLAVRQPDLSKLREATGFTAKIPLTQTIIDIAEEIRRSGMECD